MSKKSDSYYFENFIQCVECGCQAARMLEENLAGFSGNNLEEIVHKFHEIEHDADKKKHEMMGVLVKAFITPIEREDITIRPEAIEFAKVIIRCCETLKEIMQEFADFKKSKTLHGLIVEINALEEEGDRMYMEIMRRLHAEVSDPMEIIAWREIFNYLEKCCDACEHVADVVESVMMKNT